MCGGWAETARETESVLHRPAGLHPACRLRESEWVRLACHAHRHCAGAAWRRRAVQTADQAAGRGRRPEEGTLHVRRVQVHVKSVQHITGVYTERGPLRAVHLSRHNWAEGLINLDSRRLSLKHYRSGVRNECTEAALTVKARILTDKSRQRRG